MCGIFALFLNRPLSDQDVSLGRAGTAALVHRGPDGKGEWIDREKGVYLGHRRLSIIDLSDASAQPMVRGESVIVYNGEIYNFRELRSNLKGNGVEFESSGDVEVLLQAWRTWKRKSLDRLDGMFAFVIWDGSVAYLAVDPFGEKPLYWAETRDGIYVSSELRPLAGLLKLKPFLTEELMAAYLSLGTFPAPYTAFAEIKRMPPSSWMTVRHGKAGSISRYWDIPVPQRVRGRVKPLSKHQLDSVRDALTESIEGRLISDRPLSLFLSAGVDSSLIAAIASREIGVKLDCLTVSFPHGQVRDESSSALAIAQHLGLPHQTLEVNEDPDFANIARVIDLFGQPSDNVSSLAVFQLAKVAEKKFKVALSGMGGDEIIAGYNKYPYFYKNRFWYLIPEAIRIFFDHSFRSLGNRFEKINSIRSQFFVRDRERYISVKNYLLLDWLRDLPGFKDWTLSQFGNMESDTARAVYFYEICQGFSDEHLLAYDLATMRASLELRSPFLNRALCEVIANFDFRVLVAFGQKYVLRQLLERYLPKALFDHPKSGFSFPQERFLRSCEKPSPSLSGVSERAIRQGWEKRFSHSNWSRLNIRLAVADDFMKRFRSETAKLVRL